MNCHIMTANWDIVPEILREKIIKMNPTLKQIHKQNMEPTHFKIRCRRRDYACIGCTRTTVFSHGHVHRRPSIRLFFTKNSSDSQTVRFFGECLEHRTKPYDETKIIIPRNIESSEDDIFKFVLHYLPHVENMLIYRGVDETDVLIKRSILDGNIHRTFERRRPRWDRVIINVSENT